MKRTLLISLALLTGSVFQLRAADDPAPNTLTDAEKDAGWKLLFNGKDFSGWHNFKHDGVRPGWQVEDGSLVCADPHNAGDLVTADKYDWFELQLDYNISEGGNSGIMYHVTDEGGAAWASGPEFQLEDNAKAATRSAAVGSMPYTNPLLTLPLIKPSTPPNPPANGTMSACSSLPKNANTTLTGLSILITSWEAKISRSGSRKASSAACRTSPNPILATFPYKATMVESRSATSRSGPYRPSSQRLTQVQRPALSRQAATPFAKSMVCSLLLSRRDKR